GPGGGTSAGPGDRRPGLGGLRVRRAARAPVPPALRPGLCYRGNRTRLGGAGYRVRIRNAALAPAMETAMMPRLQAPAGTAAEPAEPCSSSPRSASMTSLAGWCAANPWSQPGIVLTGTNALLG